MSGVTNLFFGVMLIVLSIPLVQRRVPMNWLYGFRISKAYQSDENWYQINEYAGRRVIFWSVPLLFAGLLSLLAPQDSPLVQIFMFAPLLLIVIPIVETVLFASKL